MDKGNTFFKNTALLMALFPIYAILSGLIVGTGQMVGAIPVSDLTTSTGLIHTGVIVAIVAAALQVLTGFLGMKNADEPEKLKSSIFLGSQNFYANLDRCDDSQPCWTS